MDSSKSKIDVGLGWWSDSQNYSRITGLPVIASIRAITAGVIQQKLMHGPAKVLSLGIGTGALYKEFFREDLSSGKLTLFGIDILESMINDCKAQFPLPNVQLEVADLLVSDKFLDEKFDVVEAGLVLHHVLRAEELQQLISKLFSQLNDKGSFVLGDIDVPCGEYVESKLKYLESQHGEFKVDSQTGEFVSGDIRLPIFNLAEPKDLSVFQTLDKVTCTPLLNELDHVAPETREKLRQIILLNIESAKKGLEWHRGIETPSGWKAIMERTPFSMEQVVIVSSQNIKEKFPTVLDNPFVLIAHKTTNV
jgi:ubiquinone/menaquinone biosynthesis C-methylase UbiE